MDTRKILIGSFIAFLFFLIFVGIITMSYFARQKQILTNYATDPVDEKVYGEYKKDEIIIKFKEQPKDDLSMKDIEKESAVSTTPVQQVLEMVGMTDSSSGVPDSLIVLNENFPITEVDKTFTLTNESNVKGVSSDKSDGRDDRPQDSVYTISFENEVPVIQIAQELSKRSDIEYAEPNYIVKIEAALPNDADFSKQWGLNNTGTSGGKVDADIDAPEAWEKTTADAKTLVVAVLDTGVDTGHHDLTNRIWRNMNETVFNGIDDDNNGFIDDVHGWNFLDNNYNSSDSHGHGTHVSGIIAAERGNGIGTAGVADKVKIMPVKFLNSNGEGNQQGAAQGIYYAVDNGAQVISCSFGLYASTPPQTLYNAINYARSHGVMLVVAAGNESVDIGNASNSIYPADYDLDNIIVVAATTRTDQLATYSNYSNTKVDLAAPGSDIYSTFAGDTYKSISGTSMATPFVSGAVALAWSHYPNASYIDIRGYILASVDKISTLNGKVVTGGRLNINTLVAQGPVVTNTPIPTRTIMPSATRTPTPIVTSTPTNPVSPIPTFTIAPTGGTGSCPKKNIGDADCAANSAGKSVDILDYAIWYSEFIHGCSSTNLAGCGTDNDHDGNVMDANFNFPGTNYISTDMKVDIFDYAVWIQGFTIENGGN